MNFFKKAILIILITILSAYIIFLYSFGQKVTKIVNDSYSARKIAIPNKIFQTKGWKNLTDFIEEKINNTESLNKGSFESFNWYLKNLENYNIFFKKAKYSFSFFGIECTLEDFAEENSDGILEYTSPVKFGFNIFTQTLYLSYKGKILVKNHPISETAEFIININTSNKANINFNTILDEKEKLNPWFLLSQMNTIGNYVSEFSIYNKNKELLISKDYSKREISFAHDKNYLNVDELILSAPRDISVNIDTKFSNFAKVSNFKIFSLLGLLDHDRDKKAENLSWRFKNNQKDWSDITKILMNAELYISSKFYYPEDNYTNSNIEIFTSSPKDSIIELNFVLDASGKQTKNSFLKFIKEFETTVQYPILKLTTEYLENKQNEIPENINSRAFIAGNATLKLKENIGKEDLKVNLPEAKFFINDVGIELNASNTTLLNPIGLEGAFEIFGVDTIINLNSDFFRYVMQLNSQETEILTSSLKKMVGVIFKEKLQDSNTKVKSENIYGAFKTDFTYLKFNNYDLQDFYRVFNEKIIEESTNKLTPEQKIIFLSKLKVQ